MSNGVIALVLLAALMHASWNALLRGGRDRFWVATVMAFSSGIAGLSTIPFVPAPARASWPYIFISGVVHLIYQLLLVRMYRQGDFGHTYPIARGTSPMLIALGGIMLASERLQAATIVGIILISLGIFTLAFGGKAHVESVSAALATGCSIAVYSLVDGLGVRLSGNAVSYTAWMVISYGLPMPLVFLLLRKGKDNRLLQGSVPEATKAIGGGVIGIVGYGIVIWAMEHGPMGPVSALRETSVLFAVWIGWMFLGERFTVRKAFSSLLIVCGAMCLHFGR